MGRTIGRFGTLLTGTIVVRAIVAGAACLVTAGCVLTQGAWSPPQLSAPQPWSNSPPNPVAAPQLGEPGPAPYVPQPERRLRIDSDPRNLVPELGPSQPAPQSESRPQAPDAVEESPVERRTPDEVPGTETTPSRSDRVPTDRLPTDRAPADRLPNDREPEAPRKPPEGPEFRAPERGAAARIELTIKAPDECLVDDQVVYAITLRNTSDVAVQGVKVEVSFDEALVFPGSTETRVGREFDEIEPGGTKQFSLTLVAAKAGRHCCRFTVLEQSVESASKSTCVEVSPRKLSVSIVGPTERFTGARAEFNVKIANTSEAAHRNIRLSLAYEPALKPVEWSNDAEKSEGRLSWKLGDFAPGEGAQVQVEFECLRASEETCLSAFVSVDGAVPERRQFCLKIAAADGPLSLEASDEDDPITVGKQSAYVVRVKNRGVQAVEEVAVKAEAPLSHDVLSARAEIDGKATAAEPAVDGRIVTFKVDSLPVDAELKLRIRVQAATIGDDRLRVTVTSAGQADLTTAEPTTVNPARPQ